MRLLYVMYWGATEPLGRSLVLPALTRLADEGEEIFLVTFDKPSDFHDPAWREPVEKLLAQHNIRWKNLVYHKRPANLSSAYDIAHGVAFCWWWALRHRIRVVHARTFVGGTIGWLLSYLAPIRYIFHNEGFWPDERVDDQVWRFGSRAHRLARWIERSMYQRADAIVVLSRRARERLLEAIPQLRERQVPIEIVPSCVDLDRFGDTIAAAAPPAGEFRLVYVGSMGGRYLIDELMRFFRVAREVAPQTRCRIITRTDPNLLRERAAAVGLDPAALDIGPLEPQQIPAELARQHAAVFLLKEGLSNLATSATKVGEYLAAGLPVASTAEAGDIDLILGETRTGVVVREHSDAAYAEAVRGLLELRRDRELAGRCRAAAERYYALSMAVERQAQLHRRMAGA